MSKRQSSNPRSPLESLLPALTHYRDSESLGQAIFRCIATPNRTAQEILKIQQISPTSSEALALSALHAACSEGLIQNIPDSPGLRRALGVDAAYLRAHEKALRAARGEEHLLVVERSVRAAVFLREAATRTGLLMHPGGFLRTPQFPPMHETPIIPQQQQPTDHSPNALA